MTHNTSSVVRDKIYKFLAENNVNIGVISKRSVSLQLLFPGIKAFPELTEFSAIDDMRLYADLLTKLLNITQEPSKRRLIDLGSGSCIPTILALSRSNIVNGIDIIAVDCDAGAIEIGRRNVSLFGMEGQYTFLQSDMLQYLSGWKYERSDIISANPPYMPTPQFAGEEASVSVDGGRDGTKYLAEILNHSYPSGALIAVEWSSLSNPLKIIRIINQWYDVIHMTANRAQFGLYANSPVLRPYLETQRNANESIFETDSQGNNALIFISTILRRR